MKASAFPVAFAAGSFNPALRPEDVPARDATWISGRDTNHAFAEGIPKTGSEGKMETQKDA
jgi:hypothetical protein